MTSSSRESQPLVDFQHYVPAHQPRTIHELLPKLYSLFTIDGGRVKLAGCSIQDVPYFFVEPKTTNYRSISEPGRTFFGADGRQLDPEELEPLALDEIVSVDEPPLAMRQGPAPRDVLKKIERLAEKLADQIESIDAIGVAWSKHATGKLAIQIGDQTVHTGFTGWMHRLAEDGKGCPAYHCPMTQRQSYHLAADADGVITVAEAIKTCELTGDRVIESGLAKCAVTGSWVRTDRLYQCPVSHERIVESVAVACPACRQNVAPSVLVGRADCGCLGRLQPVADEQAWLDRLIQRHPKLSKWSKWKIGHRDEEVLLTASRWLTTVFLVVDDGGEVRHVAVKKRYARHWRESRLETL